MVAEVPHHLDETLLGGGAGQGATWRSAEQPLPGEAEHGIVLRWGPGEIPAFEGALHGFVLSFDRPYPEPGQNDIHGKIGYQEMAEHYGTVIVPARIKKPRDKAKVEVGVQIAERQILAALCAPRGFAFSAF